MRFIVFFVSALLAACQSSPPAPVIDRTPDSRPKQSVNKTLENKAPGSKTPVAKEWRPDSHVVKKGDTLFAIGLEYGIDYKEIAAANHIAPPYPIHLGQKLDLTSFKVKTVPVSEVSKTEIGQIDAGINDDGVVITPMKTEPTVIGDKPIANDQPIITEKPIASTQAPVLSEPKALREPYSLAAMNRAPDKVVTVVTKATETKPTVNKPAETISPTTTGDEAITWSWPTQGKITANFNEATNKGIDIGGETGQAIHAASAGKVIYSGSDLRGYGKLVIVKHNKTYLSVYAHNSKIVVKEGQNVAAGQKIAEMGNTDANSTRLHFEIRRLGKSVDPAKYLN